jgi:plastocyanin
MRPIGFATFSLLSLLACGPGASSVDVLNNLRSADLPILGEHDHADDPVAAEGPPVQSTPLPEAGPSSRTETGTLAVEMPSSVAMRLNEMTSVKLSVSGKNGFTGAVSFKVDGLPAGVTATFLPATATVGATPASVELVLRSASDLVGKAGIPLTVVSSAGDAQVSSPLSLDLVQEVIITIASGVELGTNAAPNTKAFGGTESTAITFVAPGTKVTFVNMDTRAHQIHATGSAGLRHQGSAMAANGGTYTSMLTTGTAAFRCHIHSNMTGQLVVK